MYKTRTKYARRTRTKHVQNMYKTRTKYARRTRTKYVQNTYKIRTKHVQNTHAEHVQNTYKIYTRHVKNMYKTRTKYVQNTYKTQTGIRIKDVQKTFRIQWELFQEIILMICTHVHPKNIPNVMTLSFIFLVRTSKIQVSISVTF